MYWHSYETQGNESVNNIIEMLASKQKTDSKTKSLANFVMITVVIKNWVLSKFRKTQSTDNNYCPYWKKERISATKNQSTSRILISKQDTKPTNMPT